MRTIITAITAIIVITAITTTARAYEPDRCAADISRAEASAFESSRTQHECMDPAECRVADELVRAALAQLAAVRQLCSVPAPAVSVADPFETTTADDSDAAWVVTSQVAEDFGWAVRP